MEKGVDYGIYHSVHRIKDNPLVSVIIPNKDHHMDLDTCIRGIEERATYKNLEFIVVENNSTKKETFDYYDRIQKEFSNVRVVNWEREFNYAAINNYGVTFAKGKYLLFLNNDTELIAPNFIEELLAYASAMMWGLPVQNFFIRMIRSSTQELSWDSAESQGTRLSACTVRRTAISTVR